MSMLAEPRRKQKWSLNPRGKHWSEDSNKFGQKMLEKMGWSSGKGLGANEQGMTEHVRVSVKNDTAGFGFSIDKQDQAWTEQQDNFNDFLQQLQCNQESVPTPKAELPIGTLSGKSLEQRSKQSKARVHYQKFTRGKDVNKYSTKDLASIFGQKDLSEKVIKQEVKEDHIPGATGSVDKTAGNFTVSSASMTDYFKQKDLSYAANRENKTNRDSNSGSEGEQYMGFGFASSVPVKQSDLKKPEEVSNYAFDNPCLNLNGTTVTASPITKSKLSKKRKKEFAFENGGLDLNYSDESTKGKTSKDNSTINENGTMGFVNDALNLDTQADESHNGKMFEVSRTQFGLSNDALDLTDENLDKKRVTFNDHVEYSTDSTVKKKKTTLDKFEVEGGKRKKKRKREEFEDNSTSMGFVNTALDLDTVSEEVNDNEANERKIKKAKRKKEKRITNLETIEEAVDEDKETQGNSPIDPVTLDESIEVLSQVNTATNGDISKKRKKKKKKEKENTENVTVLDITNEPEVIQAKKIVRHITEMTELRVEEISVPKAKKKKGNKVKPPTIIDTNEEQISLDDQTIQDIGVKKKKKHKKSTIKAAEIAEASTFYSEITDSKEVSDKEHTGKKLVDDLSETKLPKKEKKSNKSKNTAASQSNAPNEAQVEKEHTEVCAENRQSPGQEYRKGNTNGAHVNRSPWADKAKMSKRMLMALFHKNLIAEFPGANVHEIKGYAADMDCNTW